MAQQFVTSNGALTIPGAYPSFTVESQNSGIATTGVLMIVGESSQGPDATLETDINSNAFGPGSVADVVAKYGDGPIVNAFRGAIAAANDPEITGSFQRAILVKTNPSLKAASTLVKFDTTDYATIQDKTYGRLGNLISRLVTTKQAEVVPTTTTFAFLPPIASTNISLRVNGGSAQALTISAQETPAAFRTALNGLSGIDVTGGTDEAILGTSGTPIPGNLSLVIVSGNRVSINFSVPYGAIPAAGDTLWIPVGSVLSSVHANNAGSYIVTGASASSIQATKLLDATGTPAQLTAPTAQGSIASAVNTSVMAFFAMSIHLFAGANPIPGIGKALEIAELTSSTGRLSYLTYELDNSGAPFVSTWMSKSSTPNVLVSASEYIAKLTVARQLDSITEDLSAGGGIALKIGYLGTTGSLVNDGTTVTITVVGGSGSSPAPLLLADYPTIGDLASYIGSLTGFTAAPGTAVLGQQPSTSLDQGTFAIGSTFATAPGRIKQDGYKFFNTVRDNSVLVQLSAQPAAGQPAPQALGFLSGGAKGATTDATFNAAIDKLALARGNFLIPLFSRDASLDIDDNLTDVGSTYTIANIHSYCRAHVLSMSTLKRRRNRQAFLSIRDTFDNDKTAAGNMASFRCSMAFQDVKDLKSTGGIFQFQPWMAAVKAAGVQAAGFYRPLFRKNLAISGALQAEGDFDPNNDDQMEDALLSGLLPIKQDETGGFYFVSDQTTYGKDTNFVYNSIQAVYVADTVTLTIGQVMEKAFVGQSLADVSAGFALATLDSIMEDMRRLKLTAASDDAPKGFKNAKIKINGGTMQVSLEIKLAGALYFVPISVLVSAVQQTAG